MSEISGVALGAPLLDRMCPNWCNEIVIDAFKLGDLLRLLGGRQEAIRRLKLVTADFTTNEELLQRAGLSSKTRKGARRATERKTLEKLWREEIRTRQK